MPLQAVCYEFSSETLDAELEINILKKKAEKLHQSQMHDKSTP